VVYFSISFDSACVIETTLLNSCGFDSHVGSLNSSSSVAVKALCVSTSDTAAQGVSGDDSKFSSPPPVCGGVEERCKMSLQHVALGLQCLQYLDSSDKDSRQEGVEEKSSFQVCVSAVVLMHVYCAWSEHILWSLSVCLTLSLPKSTMVDLSIYVLICQRQL
jgi:hypothetical protein